MEKQQEERGNTCILWSAVSVLLNDWLEFFALPSFGLGALWTDALRCSFDGRCVRQIQFCVDVSDRRGWWCSVGRAPLLLCMNDMFIRVRAESAVGSASEMKSIQVRPSQVGKPPKCDACLLSQSLVLLCENLNVHPLCLCGEE